MTTSSAAKHADRVLAITEKPESAKLKTPDTVITRSWSRCVGNFELLPDSSHRPRVVEAIDLKERQQSLGSLLSIAQAECNILYDEISRSGYAVILTDAHGVIVYYDCDPSLQDSFNKSGLQVGANWSEECEGTNGIGTCLLEDRPIIVHRNDHFHAYNIGLSCTAIPIHDVEGHQVAALDVSSVNCRDNRNTQNHTAALVRMSARHIENSNFLDHFRTTSVIRFHKHPEYVGLSAEGLLAISDEGKILGINLAGIELLNLQSRDSIVGKGIEEILDLTAETLSSRANRIPHAAWPVLDRRIQQRYYCLIRQKVRQPVAKHLNLPVKKSVSVPTRTTDTICCMNLDDLIGCDPHMAYNVRCAKRVANKSVTILLCGETGTGKEAFSHAIHNASERADKPFIAVNCAAIPESLIESELFGYKHGAFTGARKEGMPGSIQQSNGGTLFLDEIGDMPPQLQTRLLRVLEEKEVRPLGSQVSIPIDLHVISATNANLKKLVETGQFREDLYYRLNGIVLTLPSLRDRNDLDKLLRCILALENDTGDTVSIEKNAYQRLLEYHWPGNIRELRNVLRTAMALSDEGVIRLADLPVEIVKPEPKTRRSTDYPIKGVEQDTDINPEPDNSSTPLESAEKETIMEELERNHWSITNTAKQLDISRSTLYRKAKKYGIPVSQK